MRKRLYKGVVKRACDDPGCDREWPCERHGQVPTLEQKKSALHGAYLSARQSPALADDSVNWPTANDLDAPACLNCGYVVCACKREEMREYEGAEFLRDRPIDWTMFRPSSELSTSQPAARAEDLREIRRQLEPEPVTAEDVKLYLRARTAEPVAVGQRYLGLEAWEVNYEDGTPFLSGLVADATVRAWKAQREQRSRDDFAKKLAGAATRDAQERLDAWKAQRGK